MTLPRILWVSDSPTLLTGFGTVTREVLTRLAYAGFPVACLGWGYDGWPYDRRVVPFDVFPSQLPPLGADNLERAVAHFRPDVVISLGDVWMVEWLKDRPQRQRFRWWMYVPLDGGPLPPAWLPSLEAADLAIACANFGRELVHAMRPELRMEMIYHGVDTAVFRPLPERDALRARGGLGERFVVGCVARNQPRKHLPLLVRAFARFCRDRPEAMLYLHSDPDDVGWNLRDLARRYGLENRMLLSRAATMRRGLAPEQLNEVYNAFDVFVLPSGGEGFGIPIVEAMAAGVPVVATGYSACVELVQGRGELIAVRDYLTVGRHNIDHALPDEDDLVSTLERLHASPELRARHRRAGLEFVRDLDWTRIADRWVDLLKREAPVPAAGTAAS